MSQHPDLDETALEVPQDPLNSALAAAFGPEAPPPAPFSPSVLARFQGAGLAIPNLRLREPAAPDGPPRLPAPGGGLDAPVQAGRYWLFGEIARGGMGTIFRGHDLDLGRDLAIKVLQEEHQRNPEMLRRFVEEAQIGGQLQHPGIVPVHELGQLPDRRPYFSMKLIQGWTLAALLKARTDPALDRPRFLTIFLQVCQTLAYAHARGVIHRDLKPANVMVGAFGEVQVMDWGLAKVVSPAAETRTATPAGDHTETLPGPAADARTGPVMGTPAYMAPEQARGEIGRLDERCDVFGLGGILCEVLTGKPSFGGRSRDEVLRHAARCDLADATARLDACGADPDLLRLTKTCLAASPEDRPRDAGAVAEAVTAYLASVEQRLRAAEVAKAEAKARAAQERKARRLTVALAGSLLGTVLLGVGGWWWTTRQRHEREAAMVRQRQEREAATAREVSRALEEASQLRGEAKGAEDPGRWAAALSAAEHAQGLLETGEGADDLRRRAREVLQALRDEAEQAKERARQAEADRRMAARLEAIRLLKAEVKENRFDTARAAPEYAAAFGEYGIDVQQLDAAEAAAQVRRRAIADTLVAALDDWASVLPAGPERTRLQDFARAADADPWRNRVRDALVQNDPRALLQLAATPRIETQPAATLVLLAKALAVGGRTTEAVALLRRAQQRYPADFWINHELGSLLLLAQPPQLEEALRFYMAALALRPQSPGAHINLGIALRRRGDTEGAIAAYRQAIRLKPDYAEAHNNLGLALTQKGDAEGAIAAYRQAIRLKPDCAEAHINLGTALWKKGELVAAVAAFKDAIRLRPDQAEAFNNLGIVLRQRGDLDGALVAYRKAIELRPADAQAHNNLGNVLLQKKDLDGAIACFQRAIELQPREATAHFNLGQAYHQRKDPDRAVAAYQRAVQLNPNFPEAQFSLGLALTRKGDLDDAIAALRRAVELRPDDAKGHAALGLALSQKGDVDGAVAAYRKTVHLQPDDAFAHNNLGNALARKGEPAEAILVYRRAIRLKPDYALAHNNLGLTLYQTGDLDGAVAAHRKAIELQPDFAEAHLHLGRALRDRGQFAEALAALKRGHELGSKDPKWRFPSQQWVSDCERLIERERQLPAVLRGDAKPADAERIDLARVCHAKQRYAAAARLYGEALSARPDLADDLRRGHRYQAACAAALAGGDRGKDDPAPDDRERARLRNQALEWLRSDLALWTRHLGTDPAQWRGDVQRKLRHWQRDANLAGLRDEAALAKLPEAEREPWRKLWADVEALLQKAHE